MTDNTIPTSMGLCHKCEQPIFQVAIGYEGEKYHTDCIPTFTILRDMDVEVSVDVLQQKLLEVEEKCAALAVEVNDIRAARDEWKCEALAANTRQVKVGELVEAVDALREKVHHSQKVYSEKREQFKELVEDRDRAIEHGSIMEDQRDAALACVKQLEEKLASAKDGVRGVSTTTAGLEADLLERCVKIAQDFASRSLKNLNELQKARATYGSDGATSQDIASASGQHFAASEIVGALRALVEKK